MILYVIFCSENGHVYRLAEEALVGKVGSVFTFQGQHVAKIGTFLKEGRKLATQGRGDTSRREGA